MDFPPSLRPYPGCGNEEDAWLVAGWWPCEVINCARPDEPSFEPASRRRNRAAPLRRRRLQEDGVTVLSTGDPAAELRARFPDLGEDRTFGEGPRRVAFGVVDGTITVIASGYLTGWADDPILHPADGETLKLKLLERGTPRETRKPGQRSERWNQ